MAMRTDKTWRGYDRLNIRMLKMVANIGSKEILTNPVRAPESNIVHVVLSAVVPKPLHILLEGPFFVASKVFLLLLIGPFFCTASCCVVEEFRANMKVAALLSATCWASAVSAAFDLNRGGAVLKAPAGDSFRTVTGTFTVPNLSGSNRLSIWVGIGDTLEQDNVLGGGVVYNSTLKSFAAYFPGPTTDTTSTVSVAYGNSITVTVSVSDAGGTVTIENKTQNRRTTQTIAGPAGIDPSALTALAADWFVQSYQVTPGQLVATPNFGTISFTAVTATTKNGVNVPISGAGRYEIQGTSGQVSF